MNQYPKKYDLAFIGLGAANSLIIQALFHSKALQSLKIAVIEPDPKTQNDKTFCFWATPEELNALLLSSLSDQYWRKVSCRKNETMDIAPLNYYHVSSITLYNHIKEILATCNVDYYPEVVSAIDPVEDSQAILLTSTHHQLIANVVFDSRPPLWEAAKKHQSYLWQSFLGWKIKTTEESFDKDVFTMMDFNVDQSDATQFVYILPYAKDHALVELTRFGSHCIDHDHARTLLEKYCQQRAWKYTILEEEQGMIPMCSKAITPRTVNAQHIQTGAAAGSVKPSTGYAFKEMAIEALRISKTFSRHKKVNQSPLSIKRKGRFAFYDRLLLKILEKYPSRGKLIFTQLFDKVETRLVLKFLEQKTSLTEDITVMKSLPKRLFIHHAILDCISRLQPVISHSLSLLITLLLIAFQFAGMHYAAFVLLLFGMLTLGIPHGAIDHIIDKKEQQGLAVFVLYYLLKGAAMLLIWKISPLAALVFFILYSAWHFGEGDFIRWKIHDKMAAYLWGLGLLLFLLFSHSKETSEVLTQIVQSNTISNAVNRFQQTGLFSALILMIGSLALTRNKCLSVNILSILLLAYIPLLEAFGVYFIFQHSRSGWIQIKERLQKNDIQLWKQALPFSLGAFILLATCFLHVNFNWKEQVGTFFIFLSCVSFPHVISMHNFYKKRFL